MPPELTLEQQFVIAAFNSQTELLTKDQAIDLLQQLHKQMIVKDYLFKQLINKGLQQEFDSIINNLP